MGWTLWDWPFLDETHHSKAREVAAFAARIAPHGAGPLADEARSHVRALGAAGLLDIAVPEPGAGGYAFDVRALCAAREPLVPVDAVVFGSMHPWAAYERWSRQYTRTQAGQLNGRKLSSCEPGYMHFIRSMSSEPAHSLSQ